MGDVGKGKVDPTKQINFLRPYAILQEDKAFQAFVELMNGELKRIGELSWQMTEDVKFAGDFDGALNDMGLTRPMSHQEMLQIFMCFRAVRNYWESKLMTLKKMKTQYESLQEKLKLLQKIEAKGDKK